MFKRLNLKKRLKQTLMIASASTMLLTMSIFNPLKSAIVEVEAASPTVADQVAIRSPYEWYNYRFYKHKKDFT